MANSKELKSLSDIFKEKVQFIIPDYQRGYSWETRQRTELWEDIANITDDRDHYTGMFTFCPNQDNENTYYIVDGQQRMTTLIILINEILKRIEYNVDDYTTVEDCRRKYLYLIPINALQTNYRYKFQYTMDDPSDIFFKINILELNIPVTQISQTLYTKNLLAAKNEFAEKLDGQSQDFLKNLFKKVTQRLLFHEYIINDESDVHVTFETMNNRGKSLSTLELLKNRLIYLTTIFPKDRLDNENATFLRKTINNTWKEIYKHLGSSTTKILNDDSFLKDHWIMYFRYDRKKSMVFKDDLLSLYFTSKRIYTKELTPQDIFEYVSSLSKSIVEWYKINCPNDTPCSEKEKIGLTKLNRVGIGSFRPLLMAAYLKNNGNIEKLLSACERFRFLVSHLTDRRSNTADSHFYNLAHTYYCSKDMDIKALEYDVNDKTDRWFNFDIFVSSCIDRYKKNSGFYSWKGTRYFLFEYERDLQMTSCDKTIKCNWDDFVRNQKEITSIEHIYPQTPTDTYWTSRFLADSDKVLVNSLGNLLLLSIGKNIQEQNYSFDKKKNTTRENGKITHHGYDSGSYSELEVVQTFNEWTPESIINRGRKLLNFLIENWEINVVLTEENINKILNIHPKTAKISHPIMVDVDDEIEVDEDEL
jgi:uncharacterized protein with ParB-like and HNH nuclease domain